MVRNYVRKRTFSTRDRILVHLSAEALQPAEQTQEGVAAATRSGRSTLTKWLDRLEKRGLVTRERIRLPDHPLPKYAYRLTDAGWQAAAALRGRLGSELVTVRAPNLGALAVRLTEVPTLAATRLDLTATVAAVRRGRLDLTRASLARKDRGPAVWGGALRRVDRFFGRDEERRQLDAWWDSDSPVLVLTGLAGIGKSALVAAWVQGRRIRSPVYGFEARRSSTPAGFLSDLGAFLATLGKPGLTVHVAQGVPLASSFIGRLLDRDLDGQQVLVIVDNADQAGRDLGRLIRSLFLAGPRRFRAKVLLVGRRVPRWTERIGADQEPEVRHLSGLDPGSSKALLRSRGLNSDSRFAEEVVRKTRGHPLLLHLAASTGTGHGPVVQRYLEREVWDALLPDDRAVLEAASIFRKAVGERVLEKVAGTDRSLLEGLTERNLLERTLAGGYAMHDLLREFVRAQMPENRRRRLHGRAAGVLLKMTDSRDRWEGVYHLMEAGELQDAAKLLDSEGEYLMDSVAAQEIASLVHGLKLDERDTEVYCVFAEILGDSLRIRGHVGPALYQYAHARQLADTAALPERIPRLLRKIAFLERCRNRYPRALGHLVEAQARLRGANNSQEMIEVLRELALAERAMGNLDEASRDLNEAIDLATDSADHAALSRSMLALGILEMQRGHPVEGLQLDLEALRIAQRSGNVTETAHAHVVVGAALISTDRPRDSLRHLEEGFEAARLLGNLRLMAYATSNQTSALLHLGRYEEASSTLRAARDFFEVLEEKDTVGFLKTYEGELEMGLGHWTRASSALRAGISELREHGTPAELALVLWDTAAIFERHGNGKESEAYLSEAREVARKVGNLDLVARIDAKLSTPKAGSPGKARL